MKKSIFLIFAFLFGCTTTVVEKSNDNQKPISTNSSSLNLTNDPNNCGSEGYTCVGGRSCVNSRCYPAWLLMNTVDAPSGRAGAAAGNLNNKFVLIGGCETTNSDSAPTNNNFQWDPETDSWSSFPSLNTHRTQHAVASSESGLFVVGGLDTCYEPSGGYPAPESINNNDSSWNLIGTSNYLANYNLGAVWTGKSVFTYGGAGISFSATSDSRELLLGKGWVSRDSNIVNSERSSASIFLDGDYIRIWGGAIGYGDAPNGLSFNLKTNKWSKWNIPSGTPDFASIAPTSENIKFGDDGRRLYYLSNTHNVWIFDKESQYWSMEDLDYSMPLNTCYNGATAWVGSELIIFGGMCDDSISSVGARYQPPAIQ